MGYFNRGMYFEFLLKKAKLAANTCEEEAIKIIDDAIEETYGVAILVYHNISNDSNQYCVSAERFEEQMRYLKKNGYNIINYSDLKNGNFDYKKSNVIITFDDARKGLLVSGERVLEAIPYTLFIAPTYQNNYSYQNRKDDISDFLTWEEIEKLRQRTKVVIGAHSYNHLDMSKMEIAEVHKEITMCNSEIMNNLGVDCEDFAFPYGRYSKEMLKEISNSYTSISTLGTGLNTTNVSLQSLRRTTVLNMFNEKNFHDIINYENVRERFMKSKREMTGNSI